MENFTKFSLLSVISLLQCQEWRKIRIFSIENDFQARYWRILDLGFNLKIESLTPSNLHMSFVTKFFSNFFWTKKSNKLYCRFYGGGTNSYKKRGYQEKNKSYFRISRPRKHWKKNCHKESKFSFSNKFKKSKLRQYLT